MAKKKTKAKNGQVVSVPPEFVKAVMGLRQQHQQIEAMLIDKMKTARQLLGVPEDWLLDVDLCHFRPADKNKDK